MMVDVTIENNMLILEVEGLDKLWTLKSHLEIPLAHVTGVRADSENIRDWWHGIKLPGTNLPGVIKAGTFVQNGQRVFWDIQHPDNGIVIELTDDRYKELIIEVANPDEVVVQIQAAIDYQRSSRS
jgi:hypothetical protein